MEEPGLGRIVQDALTHLPLLAAEIHSSHSWSVPLGNADERATEGTDRSSERERSIDKINSVMCELDGDERRVLLAGLWQFKQWQLKHNPLDPSPRRYAFELIDRVVVKLGGDPKLPGYDPTPIASVRLTAPED